MSKAFGPELGDPVAERREIGRKTRSLIKGAVNRDRKDGPRPGHPQQFPESLWPDMAGREGARADAAGIGTVGQRQYLCQIGGDGGPVDLLLRRNGEHLGGNVEPVDGTDTRLCQGLTDEPRSRADIEDRPGSAQRGKDAGDLGRAAIGHHPGEIPVVVPGPVAVILYRILGRFQRIGPVEIMILSCHGRIGAWHCRAVKTFRNVRPNRRSSAHRGCLRVNRSR